MRRLRTVLAGQGITGLLRFLLSRIAYRQSDVVYEWPGIVQSKGDVEKPERLTIIDRENLGSPEISALEEQVLVGYNAEYRSGLKQRDRLYVVTDESGTVIHYSFVLFGGNYRRLLGIPKDVPVIGNCETRPAARGQRLYPRTIACAARDLEEHDGTNITISCAPDNTPSIKGILHAGFAERWRVESLVILSLLAVQVFRGDRSGLRIVWLR